jgi:hypothetical protein
MTSLQEKLVEAKQKMDAAPVGSDEWLEWSRRRMWVLNELQKETATETGFPVQLERDERLL